MNKNKRSFIHSFKPVKIVLLLPRKNIFSICEKKSYQIERVKLRRVKKSDTKERGRFLIINLSRSYVYISAVLNLKVLPKRS